jgi:hypothetical protein
MYTTQSLQASMPQLQFLQYCRHKDRRGVGRAMSNCNMHRTAVDHGHPSTNFCPQYVESRSATRGPGVAWIDPNGKLMIPHNPIPPPLRMFH